jgi:hypothetical protein
VEFCCITILHGILNPLDSEELACCFGLLIVVGQGWLCTETPVGTNNANPRLDITIAPLHNAKLSDGGVLVGLLSNPKEGDKQRLFWFGGIAASHMHGFGGISNARDGVSDGMSVTDNNIGCNTIQVGRSGFPAYGLA